MRKFITHCRCKRVYVTFYRAFHFFTLTLLFVHCAPVAIVTDVVIVFVVTIITVCTLIVYSVIDKHIGIFGSNMTWPHRSHFSYLIVVELQPHIFFVLLLFLLPLLLLLLHNTVLCMSTLLSICMVYNGWAWWGVITLLKNTYGYFFLIGVMSIQGGRA